MKQCDKALTEHIHHAARITCINHCEQVNIFSTDDIECTKRLLTEAKDCDDSHFLLVGSVSSVISSGSRGGPRGPWPPLAL